MKRLMIKRVREITDHLDGATLQDAIDFLKEQLDFYGRDPGIRLKIDNETVPYEDYDRAGVQLTWESEETDNEFTRREYAYDIQENNRLWATMVTLVDNDIPIPQPLIDRRKAIITKHSLTAVPPYPTIKSQKAQQS